jgi:hypothetical protein
MMFGDADGNAGDASAGDKLAGADAARLSGVEQMNALCRNRAMEPGGGGRGIPRDRS